jgi:hypothetical protein
MWKMNARIRRPPRLELDHIAPRRRRGWPGLVLLGLSLAVAADLGLRYRDTLAAIESVPARAAVLQIIPRKSNDAEDKAARTAVRQLALPWAGLIRALEDSATPDVALLQVQPEAQQQVLRVTAEARDAAAMFKYLHGLAAARGLSQIHLVSHEVAQDDPQRPVRFAAQASFRSMP